MADTDGIREGGARERRCCRGRDGTENWGIDPGTQTLETNLDSPSFIVIKQKLMRP